MLSGLAESEIKSKQCQSWAITTAMELAQSQGVGSKHKILLKTSCLSKLVKFHSKGQVKLYYSYYYFPLFYIGYFAFSGQLFWKFTDSLNSNIGG